MLIDDMGVFGNAKLKQQFMSDLGNKFNISDKGPLQYYLGINIQADKGVVTMDQKKYIGDVLSEFNLQDEAPVVVKSGALKLRLYWMLNNLGKLIK